MLFLNSATTSCAATPRAALVGKFGKPAQTKKTLIFAKPISAAGIRKFLPSATPLFRTSPVNALIAGADPQHKLSIAMTVWLIRGNGCTTLVIPAFVVHSISGVIFHAFLNSRSPVFIRGKLSLPDFQISVNPCYPCDQW